MSRPTNTFVVKTMCFHDYRFHKIKCRLYQELPLVKLAALLVVVSKIYSPISQAFLIKNCIWTLYTEKYKRVTNCMIPLEKLEYIKCCFIKIKLFLVDSVQTKD